MICLRFRPFEPRFRVTLFLMKSVYTELAFVVTLQPKTRNFSLEQSPFLLISVSRHVSSLRRSKMMLHFCASCLYSVIHPSENFLRYVRNKTNAS